MSVHLTRADYDAAQIARATHFVVTGFLGRGRYRRRPCLTLERARRFGRRMADQMGRPVMIYAIVPDTLGTSIHVENVNPTRP